MTEDNRDTETIRQDQYEQLEAALLQKAEGARQLSRTLKQDGSVQSYMLAAVLELVESQNILIRTLARRVRHLEERLGEG